MDLNYSEWQPKGMLNSLVSCFWQYENNRRNLHHTILPDGYFELIVAFKKQELQHVYLRGLITEPLEVISAKTSHLFGVRFKLITAEYLFQQELAGLLNSMQHLAPDFWQINQIASLNFSGFVQHISTQIYRILPLQKLDQRKLKLFQLIYQNSNTSVQSFAHQVGWSSRQINRYFNQQFGICLKHYLEIMRCSNSYADISKGSFHSDLYYDQSHFIKEVKKHTGYTPKELFRNTNDRFLQLLTK